MRLSSDMEEEELSEKHAACSSALMRRSISQTVALIVRAGTGALLELQHARRLPTYGQLALGALGLVLGELSLVLGVRSLALLKLIITLVPLLAFFAKLFTRERSLASLTHAPPQPLPPKNAPEGGTPS